MADEIIIKSDDEAPSVVVEGQGLTTDNDVAIAAIDADKEIQIAQIQADADIQRSENYVEEVKVRVEAEAEKEGDIWTAIHQISEQVATLVGAVEALTIVQLSEAQPLSSSSMSDQTTAQVDEIAEELPSIQSSTSPSTSSTQTEPIVESVAESLGEIIPPVIETKRGPILKLV